MQIVHDTDPKQRNVMNINRNRGGSHKKKQMTAITKATSVAVLVTLGLALAAQAAEPRMLPQEASVVEAQAVAGSLAAKPDNGHWIILFDGKDLDAWQAPGANRWKIEDGQLAHRRGCGSLWTKATFTDFVLELEVKCEKKTNSGVFLRGPVRDWTGVTTAGPQREWHGLEIQVSDSSGERKPGKHDMGAMYDCVAPSTAAEKPVGEWNHLVISFVGNRLRVVLNGKSIIEADVDRWTEPNKNPDGSKNKFPFALKDLPKTGHIGFQDYGRPVWYRNIRIKRLAPDEK